MSYRHKPWIGPLLALLAFVSVLLTIDDPGVTWDEPRSYKASRGYMTWLGMLRQAIVQGHPERVFDDEVIVRWWVQDPTLELHPPVSKLATGLGWALFRRMWGNISAYRFSGAVWFAVLVAFVYCSVVDTYGSVGGLAASFSLLLMPRAFLHAHLANLDIPLATAWVVTAYLFWRAISKQGWLWTVLTGLAFGIALGIKLNALLMPLVWGIWCVLWRREKSVLIKIVIIGALGCAVFVAMWPWLYHDTLERLAYYVAMGYRFNQTLQYYLGRTGSAPWHYPFVLTIAVVPLTITLAYLVGIARVLKTWRNPGFGYYALLNAAIPLLMAASGLQAVYSGERHFMSAYAYLAMLAGIGFVTILETVGKQLARRGARHPTLTRSLLVVWLAVLLYVPPLAATVELHPYELSYYSEAVGGLSGARRLGLETTFWCESYKDCLPYLNARLDEGASIWVDQPFVLRAYQEDKMLRQDLRVVGWDVISPYSCDYALVQMRETGFTDVPELVDLVEQHRPEFIVSVEGVPLAMLYRLH
ncbi:MAG TPA: glycosyltransferase family 39 protein [Anaerolineae bacterium]|nr:glycosyltransferase family 39 protein [Anaerolineae bacterium]